METPKYNVVDAKTLPLLISKMNEYELKELGALVIQNSHYYQSFIGIPKDTLVVPEVVPEVTKEDISLAATSKGSDEKPKVKRKSRAKPKDT